MSTTLDELLGCLVDARLTLAELALQRPDHAGLCDTMRRKLDVMSREIELALHCRRRFDADAKGLCTRCGQLAEEHGSLLNQLDVLVREKLSEAEAQDFAELTVLP